MKIQAPLVIEMTDEQVSRYAAEYGLPHDGGPLRAKHVVDHVRDHILNDAQQGTLGEFADVTLKR